MSDTSDRLDQRGAFASRSVQRLKSEGLDEGTAIKRTVEELLPTLTDEERHELAVREMTHIFQHIEARIERGEPQQEAVRAGDDDASACSLGPDLCALEDSA